MTIGFAPHWLNVVPVVNEFGNGHLFTSFPLPLTLGEGRGEGRSYRYRVEALLPLAVREILVGQKLDADLYVGLEGGFHSISIDGEWHTFLRGWAFVTDGERGSFGMSPSISVPEAIVKSVIGGKRELGIVIDAVAGT